MKTPARALVTLLIAAASAVVAPASTLDEPFRLNLPEWDPRPEDLPTELRPLDVVRPVLPEGVAEEVAGLEERVTEIEGAWLGAETKDAQDALLDEAIGLVERLLALRVKHQGNTEGLVRWRDGDGAASEWWEVKDARAWLTGLRRERSLDESSRSALASIEGAHEQYERLLSEGASEEAMGTLEWQLSVRQDVLGAQHPSTLLALNNLGAALQAKGLAASAEPYLREAATQSRGVLGCDHPVTTRVIGNLGAVLQSQGKLSEAEPYYREALESERRVLGDEDPGTLVSINNMSVLCQSQGRLSEAEAYCRTAVDGKRRALGRQDPSTLTSISNLGILLQSQGRLAEAEWYYREAMEGSRESSGDGHADTLTYVHNMGFLLHSQGKLSEAEQCYREALEGRRRVLGDEHPDTLIAISNVGIVLASQGRLGEAEPYYREAVDVARRELGTNHPFTVTFLNNLGVLVREQSRLSEAEAYYRQALEVRQRVLGDNHPNTLTSISNMAFLLSTQRRLGESEAYWREALALAEALRVDVVGDARARAQYAEALNLSWIAWRYASTLMGLGRDAEAFSVAERGRGRAALDLLAQSQMTNHERVRATGDADRIARYEAALAAEREALVSLRDAEARLAAIERISP